MYFREGRCIERMELIRVRESKACRRRAFRFAISSLLRNGRAQELHSRTTGKHRGRVIRVILFARAALIGPLFAPASRVSFHYIDLRNRYRPATRKRDEARARAHVERDLLTLARVTRLQRKTERFNSIPDVPANA